MRKANYNGVSAETNHKTAGTRIVKYEKNIAGKNTLVKSFKIITHRISSGKRGLRI